MHIHIFVKDKSASMQLSWCMWCSWYSARVIVFNAKWTIFLVHVFVKDKSASMQLSLVYVMFLVQRESDCCLMPNEQFSTISWREHVKLWLDEMTMSTLYYTNMLSCIFIVFTPWLLADMLLPRTHLSWFRTNQSFLLFLKVVCTEAAKTNLSLWFDPTGSETTIYNLRWVC